MANTMAGKETIIVIGAGVIGLSTALCIQEHLSRSQSILIVAREFPNDTSVNYASPWAGAHYRPVPGSSAQAMKEADQAQRTYEFFTRLAAKEPASGIEMIQGIEHLEAPPPEYLDREIIKKVYSHLHGYRELVESELPPGVKWGACYQSFTINPPVYCAYMLRKFILRGGQTEKYSLADVAEAFTLAQNVKTVVNCSGMGFGDPQSFIIRGQTCLVRNPCSITLTRQNADGTWSFCIPRPLDGGTIIGGTKQPGDWDPHPSSELRQTLLENASKWFAFAAEGKGKFDVIRDIVGRRPARERGMRIEAEKLANGKTVVHAYGAGGRGFEISRGVAEDVVNLMLSEGMVRRSMSL